MIMWGGVRECLISGVCTKMCLGQEEEEQTQVRLKAERPSVIRRIRSRHATSHTHMISSSFHFDHVRSRCCPFLFPYHHI